VNLTLQYDQVLFILEPTGIARSLARKRVTVVDYPHGRLAIRYHGVDLPYRTFDKRPQVNQAAIVENKRLGPILAYIAEQQKKLDMSRSPRRRGDAARRTICSSSGSWVPGRRAARSGSFTRRPLDTTEFNQAKERKGRLSYPQPGDISKWPKS
jgi:hypothetical protein